MPESIPPNPPEDDNPGKDEPVDNDQTNEIPEHLRAEFSSRRPVMPGEESVSSASQTEMQKLDRRVDEARNDPSTPIAANYKLLDHIGQGTFGTVYEAINVVTEEHVAIKFFLRGGVLESVIDETRMLGKLAGCTGIMGYKEVSWTSEDPYYVMSLATGGSLADYLRETPPDPRTAVRLFEQIIEAMAFVHAKGVIHCDLKPGNILLSEDGHPLIADFGQSHLASNITPALGTFFYMAPEQASLDATVPDTRWDVYALGAILHEMLTGSPPRATTEFREGLAELRTAHTKDRLKYYRTQAPKHPVADLAKANSKIDFSLANLVAICLDVNPERRPRDAGVIRDLLLRRRRILKNSPFIRGAIQATAVTLIAIATLSYLASEKIVSDAKKELGNEIHTSLTYTAHLGSQLLEEKLRDRMDFLVKSAKKIQDDKPQIDRLRKAKEKYLAALKKAEDEDVSDYQKILSGAERQAIGDMLVNLDSDFRRMTSHGESLSNSVDTDTGGGGSPYLFTLNADNRAYHLVLCDESGTLRTDLDTFKLNWAWRDYFNGTGDKEDQPQGKFTPSDKPHFTDFYQSKRDNNWVIDLSVPIYDPDKPNGAPDRMLGKLITSMKRDRDLTRLLTGEMQSADKQMNLAETTEFAVIIRRSQQLQWNSLQRESEYLPAERLKSSFFHHISTGKPPTSNPLHDPVPMKSDIANPTCIVAWKKFNPDAEKASDREWYFLVKRSLNGVGGRSFDEIKRNMRFLGFILFAIIVGAAILSWYWLLKLLYAGDSLVADIGRAAVQVPMDSANSALTPRHHRAPGGSNSAPK